MSESPTVVLLCSDLMMTSTVSGAAAHSGLTFRTVTGPGQLSDCADDDLVIIDLASPGLNIAKAATALSDRQKHTAIIYGPHVQVDRFEQARTAGFVNLLARGQFNAEANQIVSRFAESATGST
jgi:hypothetical protein